MPEEAVPGPRGVDASGRTGRRRRATTLELTWYPNSWVHLESGGRRIAIDPAFLRTFFLRHPTSIEFGRWPDPIDGLPEALDPVDAVLVTHHHKDHCKSVTVRRISSPETLVVAPASCRKELGSAIRAVRSGERLDLGFASVDVVPAYNTPEGSSTRKQHRGDRDVGYVVELAGRRIYHAGDTDLIPEMEHLGGLDVALLPVGGRFTMDVSEAARAVGVMRPEVVVPVHRYDADLRAFERRVERVAPATRVAILGIGERLLV